MLAQSAFAHQFKNSATQLVIATWSSEVGSSTLFLYQYFHHSSYVADLARLPIRMQWWHPPQHHQRQHQRHRHRPWDTKRRPCTNRQWNRRTWPYPSWDSGTPTCRPPRPPRRSTVYCHRWPPCGSSQCRETGRWATGDDVLDAVEGEGVVVRAFETLGNGEQLGVGRVVARQHGAEQEGGQEGEGRSGHAAGK